MGLSPTTPWESIKADYFVQNLRQDKKKQFTLRELSVKWCVPYGTLRNRASDERWNEQLQEKVMEQNTEVVRQVQAEEVATETAIRRRQAKVSRVLSDLGLRRLQSIDPDRLTTREAIELVKLGLIGERQALGLARTCAFPSPIVDDKWDSVEINIKKHREIQQVAKQLLDHLGRNNPKYKDFLIREPSRTNETGAPGL